MNFHYYEAAGKTPLLVLHGLFGSSRNWKSFAQKFSKTHNMPVFALDLKNHNLSPENKFCGTVNSWTDFKADLEAFVDKHVGQSPFHLLGHSFGGQVCMASLLLNGFDKNIAKACLVDISLRYPCNGVENDHLFLLMQKLAEINDINSRSRAEIACKLSNNEQDDAVVNFLMTNLERSSDGTFKFSKLGLPYIISSWQQLKSDWLKCKEKFVPWPGEVHFVKGERSRYIDESRGDLEEINQFFPQITIHVVKNSGHWPHFDNPTDFFSIASQIFKEQK